MNRQPSPAALAGLLILLLHIFLPITANLFLSASHYAQQHPEYILSGPTSEFWLGTDDLGRDIFARTLLGGRDTVFVSLAATLIAMGVGSMTGMYAGIRGGWPDELIMRLVDMCRTMPWILPVLLIVAVIGHSLAAIMLILGLFDAIDVTRVIRGATLSVVHQEFIASARLRGEKKRTLFIYELLPNIDHVFSVEAAMRYSWMLLRFSTLSFLGFGSPPPTPDWGMMISEAAPYISLAPWASLAPALALCSLVIGVNLASGLLSSS